MSKTRILQSCPSCRKPQALRNTKCRYCGRDFRKIKKKLYYVDYFDPQGKQRREKVGESLAEAEERAASLSTDLSRGQYFRDDILFRDLARMYMESEHTQALRSYDRVERALKHILPVFGHLPINRITPDTVNSYLTRRAADPSARGVTSRCTANREVAYMRAIFNWGRAQGLIGYYPFGLRRVKMYDERPQARNRYVSREDLDRLIQCSPSHLQSILMTAYLTGMRIGEILNLIWDQVDLDRGLITLLDSKTGWGRIIPIDPELNPILRNLQCGIRNISGRVFLYHNRPISDIHHAFIQARRLVGLDDVWIHDLRGSCATNWIDAGLDQKTVMVLTGHRTDSVFRGYVKVTIERLKRAVEMASQKRKNPQV